MATTTNAPRFLEADDGLRLRSGPGRDLVFKVTGENTGGALDVFVIEVAPHGGPPLHLHHGQDEALYVISGSYKIQVGDETFRCGPGGFAYMPAGLPHTFLNLTDQPGELLATYTPGGGHRFYEEFGPLVRDGSPDRATVAAVFEKYNMQLLGPPLSPD
jgi:quercetin dioxygenase-like cupin family protein